MYLCLISICRAKMGNKGSKGKKNKGAEAAAPAPAPAGGAGGAIPAIDGLQKITVDDFDLLKVSPPSMADTTDLTECT